MATTTVPVGAMHVAYVDEEDLPAVSQHRWRAQKGGKTVYAAANTVATDGRPAILMMHRLVCPVASDKVVDHIDGDGLNNSKSNLREASHAQNMRNRRVHKKRAATVFKGVFTRRGRWAACIRHDGETLHLGTFDDDASAARQYDRAARLLFGRFAKTNETLGLLA